MRRIAKDRTSTEIYEKKEILEAVRERFFGVFRELDDRVAIIDTTGLSIDDVAEKVAAAVEELK